MSRNVLKIFALLTAFLFFFNAASAAVSIIVPVEAKVSNKDEVELGNVALGETFSIIIQKKSGENFEWDSVSANVPNYWTANYRIGDKTIIADITVPSNEQETVRVINFAVSSSSSPVEESFKGIILVKRTLLTVAMDNLKQDALVGKPINYRFVASNDSIAEHRIAIESSLPNYWFEPVELTLQPKQKQELTLTLTPQAYGPRNFSFFVRSRQSAFEKDFVSELNVAPTLQGKFLAPAYAFPFFTFSNFAYYLFNSVWFAPSQ